MHTPHNIPFFEWAPKIPRAYTDRVIDRPRSAAQTLRLAHILSTRDEAR